jgi:hypothetical protein
MGKAAFLGITKINRTPSPNLSHAVEVDGEARIIDSEGNDIVVCFYEVSSNGMSMPLGVKGGGDFEVVYDDDHEDGEFYQEGEYVLTIDDYASVEEWIVSAIDRIDREASLAAEDAWNQVWIDAAVEAEARA